MSSYDALSDRIKKLFPELSDGQHIYVCTALDLAVKDFYKDLDFLKGGRAFFDYLLCATANNWHSNPKIDAQCKKENEAVVRFANDALYSFDQTAHVEWRKIVDLKQKSYELEQDNKKLRSLIDKNVLEVVESQRATLNRLTGEGVKFSLGTWYKCMSVDQMQQFYMSRLPAIREAARDIGYAIGVHGSTRRDLDLMAMPWVDTHEDRETLAHVVAKAACGITREGSYSWEKKPSGRWATSICICWTDHSEEFKDMLSVGHIDLSVIDTAVHND